jgi:hypothetical protein
MITETTIKSGPHWVDGGGEIIKVGSHIEYLNQMGYTGLSFDDEDDDVAPAYLKAFQQGAIRIVVSSSRNIDMEFHPSKVSPSAIEAVADMATSLGGRMEVELTTNGTTVKRGGTFRDPKEFERKYS